MGDSLDFGDFNFMLKSFTNKLNSFFIYHTKALIAFSLEYPHVANFSDSVQVNAIGDYTYFASKRKDMDYFFSELDVFKENNQVSNNFLNYLATLRAKFDELKLVTPALSSDFGRSYKLWNILNNIDFYTGGSSRLESDFKAKLNGFMNDSLNGASNFNNFFEMCEGVFNPSYRESLMAGMEDDAYLEELLDQIDAYKIEVEVDKILSGS